MAEEKRYHLTEAGKRWVDSQEKRALEYLGLSSEEFNELLSSSGRYHRGGSMEDVIRECWVDKKRGRRT